MSREHFAHRSSRVPLQFFPVAIGLYHHHRRLDTEPEVSGIAELLAPFGAEVVAWDVKEPERGADAVEERLRQWASSRTPGNSFLYWAGHGESDGHNAWLAHAASPQPLDDGMTPQRLVQRLALRQGNVRGEGWSIVVIDACKSARFVELMSAHAFTDPNGPRNFLLVSTSEDGTANLGTFRKALSTVLRVTFGAEDTIDLRALGDELNRNLHGCPVIPHTSTGAALLHRREAALAGSITTSLDLLAEVEAVLDTFSHEERRHFVQKASGAELGEQAWYFEGREEERHQILTWLATARSGMLVVAGAAGSGKSALLGHVLIHTRPELRRALQRAGQLAPLPPGTPGPRNPFDAVMYLTGATPHDVVTRISRAAGCGDPPADRSPTAQAEWLLAQVRRRRRSLTLLVDALDEAHSPLVIADRILRRLAKLDRVRIVVGTRRSTHEGPDLPVPDDQDLIDALGTGAEVRVLTVGQDHSAMTRYLRKRLHAAVRDGALKADLGRIDDAARAIGSLDREFLHARLSAHEIVQTPALLDDLGTVLESDHRQIFGHAVDRLASLNSAYLPLLEALALAQGHGLPLRDGIWACAASALGGTAVSDADIASLTAAASPYLTLDTEFGQSVYRLSHRTFAEHFASPTDYDERQHRITVSLIADVARDSASSPPNPYVVHYLAAHAARGGSASWEELARCPQVLNRLDPTAVVTSVMRAAFGRFDLPPGIAGFVTSHHLLSAADREERRGIRELATVRYTGRTTPSLSDDTASRDPQSGWLVKWARLRQLPLHLPMTGTLGGVTQITALTGPNGQPLLIGASGARVRAWDATTGLPSGPPVEDPYGLNTVTVCAGPGGRPLLASSGRDGLVRILDALTGAAAGEPISLDRPAQQLAGLADPDGERSLLAVHDGTTLRVWDVNSGHALGEPVAHPVRVRVWTWVLLSHSRPLLATHGDDQMVRVWDVLAGCVVGRPIGPFNRLMGLRAFLGPGDRPTLATYSGWGGTVRVWDALTGLPRGLTVDPAQSDWLPQVWDTTESLSRGEPIGITTSGRLLTAYATPSGRPLLAADFGPRQVRVWDALTGSLVGEPITHPVEVTALSAFTGPGGRALLATGGADGSVRIWDPAARTSAAGLDDAGEVRAVTVFTGPDGTPRVASGGVGGTVRVWDGRSGDPVREPLVRDTVGARAIIGDPARDPLRAKGTYDVRALASSRTSADRTLVLATVGDGAIWAWDCTASSVGTPLNRYASSVHALQTLAGPGGRPWLATGGKAGPVRVWDILTGSPTGRPMVGHSGPVSTLAIFTGPDGHSLLASGGADSTVRVWDLVSRTQIGPPLAGVGSVHALTVVPGPGGRPWLAAAGARGLVRVWDALTGVEMGDPVAHPGGVSALTAVSDASGHTFLVSGGHGGTVRLWDPAAPAMRMDIRLDIAVFAVTAMGSDLAVGTAEGLVVVSPGWVVLEQHRRFSGAPSRVFGAGLAHAPSFRGTGGRLQDLVRGAVVRR